MISGNSSKIGPSKMAGIYFISEGSSNHVDWRASMITDLTVKTKPHPGGRSTFLIKRGF
jgi:hypothetical protein